MALITRVTRLFTADLHAVLDRLEEPDVLVKQAIREMEDELASRETRLRWLDHEHAQLTRQSADMNASLDAIAQQLDVCFASDEDTLARPLIKRRLETQHLVGRLAARLLANTQARVEETANVENNRRDLDAMRQKAEVLLDEAGSAARCVGHAARHDRHRCRHRGRVAAGKTDTSLAGGPASGEPVMTQSNRPRPSFLSGAAIAAVLAVAAGASFAGLTVSLTQALAVRIIATLLAGSYALYLLCRSNERTGRVVTVAAWCVAAAVIARLRTHADALSDRAHVPDLAGADAVLPRIDDHGVVRSRLERLSARVRDLGAAQFAEPFARDVVVFSRPGAVRRIAERRATIDAIR